MGVSYYVKLGPYIEAPNPKQNSSKGVHACTKQGCSKQGKETADAFCPQCGTKVGVVQKPIQKRIDFDVYGETDGRLTDIHPERLPNEKKDSAIFIPNQGKFGIEFGDWEAAVVEFNETVMMNDITRFKQTFATDITRIQEVFGKAEVKWGAIAYAS